MSIRSLIWISVICFLAPFSEARSEVTVYKEEAKKGIHSYVITYAVSQNWRVKGTRKMTGRGKGRISCDLEPTDGTRYPRTGHFKTINGPTFTIIDDPKSGKRLSMDIPGRIRKTTNFTVGSRSYDYKADHFSNVPTAEALAFVPLFISESRALWTLGGKTHSVSLLGFMDAWNFCVRYVDYDPLGGTN